MATIVSTPVLVWVAALNTGTGVAQSSSITATVHLTQGWETQIPVRALFTTVSADPVVNVYASSDGGATYDTVAFAAFSVSRVTNASSKASIRLPVGQYVIQILNSGPNTASFFIDTQQVLTAIVNVG